MPHDKKPEKSSDVSLTGVYAVRRPARLTLGGSEQPCTGTDTDVPQQFVRIERARNSDSGCCRREDFYRLRDVTAQDPNDHFDYGAGALSGSALLVSRFDGALERLRVSAKEEVHKRGGDGYKRTARRATELEGLATGPSNGEPSVDRSVWSREEAVTPDCPHRD